MSHTNTLALRLSTDRKTTPSANAAGTQANISNAFGLLSGAGASCPGQTSVCERVCYAGKLERVFKGFGAVMSQNWEAVRNASRVELVESLSALMDEFSAKCDKRGKEKVFRIHHDGDFFSRTYADAWATVVKRYPDIHFWAYTRSFIPGANVVDILADIPNLTLYLSVDEDNRQWAAIAREEFPSVRIAFLADTAAEGADAIKEITGTNRPGAACPEVMGRIPLITAEGGACFSCGLCVKGKADIRFSVSGK